MLKKNCCDFFSNLHIQQVDISTSSRLNWFCHFYWRQTTVFILLKNQCFLYCPIDIIWLNFQTWSQAKRSLSQGNNFFQFRFLIRNHTTFFLFYFHMFLLRLQSNSRALKWVDSCRKTHVPFSFFNGKYFHSFIVVFICCIVNSHLLWPILLTDQLIEV